MRVRRKAMGQRSPSTARPSHAFALDYSQDLAGADAVVFVFEWTTAAAVRRPAGLGAAAVARCRASAASSSIATAPTTTRSSSRGDYNHRTEESSRDWIDCLRQPVRQDLPADAATAAAERAAVPVPHLRSDLGGAAGLRRQGVRHDLCRPHQVSLARHVARAAGRSSRSATGSAASRWSAKGGTIRRNGRSGWRSRTTTMSIAIISSGSASRPCRRFPIRRCPPR